MADLLNSSTSANLAPNASTSQTVLPDWYTNYAKQILSNQQAVAAQPYAPYTAPRVADFTPTQVAGQEATTQAAGAYQPGLAAATQTVNNTAAGPAPSALAAPYLTSAAAPSYSSVQSYLNPYESNVTDQIATLGNRNLVENLLPAIGDQFVGAGGYGGSRQAEAIGKAVRQTQDDISQQQGTALASGYTGALSAAQTDAQRQAVLASTAGNLGVADVNTGLASGQAQAALAGQAQTAGLTGAGALQQVGATQQSLDQANLDRAYADYQAQLAYPQTQINNSVSTLGGVKSAVPAATLSQGYGAVPTSATTTTPSGLQDISTIIGALQTAGVI